MFAPSLRILGSLAGISGGRQWCVRLLVVLVSFGPIARGATTIWDGSAGTGAWGTATNWNTNVLPPAGNLLEFNAGAANNQFSITLGANRTTAGITFGNTGTSGFTFGGNTLILNGGLVNNHTSTQTINSAVTVNAAQTWSAAAGGFTIGGATSLLNTLTLSGAGGFAFNGTFTNSGGNRTITNNATGAVTFSALNLSEGNTARTLTFTGSGNTTVTGVIGDGGNKTGGLTYTGAATGNLILSGANTYTGVTTLNSGTLRATTNASALGADALYLYGGTLELANNTGLTFGRDTALLGNAAIKSDLLAAGSGVTHTMGILWMAAQTLTVTAGSNVNSGVAGLTFGTTTLTLNDTTFNVGADAKLTLGAFSGAFSVVKDGSGILALNTTSLRTTTAGSTFLNAGMLQLGVAGALNTNAATALTLAGGNLLLAPVANANTTFTGTATAVTADSTITSDRGGAAGAALSHTLGTLSIGANTLTVAAGSNVTSGTAGVTFGATTLTANNATMNVASGAQLTLGAVGGEFSLLKEGAGTLALNTTSTRATAAGSTTLDAGTLQLGAAGALNTNATATLTLNGGTLQLAPSAATTFTGTATTVAGNATVMSDRSAAGAGLSHTLGTLSIGANTLAVLAGANVTSGTAGVTFGATTLTGNTAFSVGTGAQATLGAVSESGGSRSLVKDGAGTLVFSATNSQTGTTTLNAGTLTVNNGATLSANTGSLVLTGGVLNLNNTGPQSVASFTGAAGTVNLASGVVFSTTTTGTEGFSGTLAGAGAFGMAGSGTFTLVGATNSYTGATSITNGTLVVGTLANGGVTSSIGAAGPAATNLVLNGGVLRYTGAATSTDRLFSLGTSGATIEAAGSGTVTFANTGALGFNAQTGARALTLSGAGNGTLAAVIGDNSGATSVTKTGLGNWTLSGANTFTGGVSVTEGILIAQHNTALGGGSSGTTVTSGATLQLNGGVSLAPNGTLTVAGTGFGGAGALVGAGGSNSWNGNISLVGDTTIKINATGTNYLDLGQLQALLVRPPIDPHTLALGSNTLTLGGGSGANEIYVNARVTGTGGLTVDMNNTGDTVFLASHLNTSTGTTVVKNGTLVPYTLPNTYPGDTAVTQYYGINGPVTIGDGVGAANSAVLSILAEGSRTTELINPGVTVTLQRDGQFAVGSAQTIGMLDATINPANRSLIFNGGNVSIGATGVLYLGGDVIVNATAGQTAVIDGAGNTLSLTEHQAPGPMNNANRLFNVGSGAGNLSDLTINATIKNGSLTKEGAGILTLTGNNLSGYEGSTTINNGILAITNGGALGMGLNTAASATIVNAGGTVRVSGGITVANEWLRLNGDGYGGTGALLNLSGINTWSGATFLDGNTRLQSDAGLLTVSGAVTSTVNANLNVRGSGNVTISGDVGTGMGALTKDGTGTLALSGTNTYGGATTINQGVLSLQSSAGLGATSAGTTVAGNGAALELSGGITTGAEPLFLNGTGISGNGALRNAAGSNSFAGLVTVSTPSLVTANAGTSLTLSGGIASANQALTLGTTANNGTINISGNIANGTGTLTKNGSGSVAFTGTTGTLGAVQLNQGTISVGGSSTLNTGNFSAAAGTTLLIASGGTVVANNATGTTTYFAGAINGTGGGTFQKTGAGVLVFDQSFNAGAGSVLVLSGGTLSLGINSALALVPTGITFGTIHITGNTILDFNNSAGTFLTSANLVVNAGVVVTVNNWVGVANTPAQSTIWTTTGTINGGTLGGTSQMGGTPLNQIVFNNYNGLTTTWVSGTGNGWFDREIRPTPEPATYGCIFVAGCVGLFGFRRYRSRRKAANVAS